MSDLAFLSAQQDHHAAVMALFHEARAWHDEVKADPWPEFDPEEVRENIHGNAVFVLLRADTVVGTVTVFESDPLIWTDDQPALYIHRMATTRRLKGNGLCKFMVDQLSLHATELNKLFLRLDCWANNEKLKRYYEQLGFVRQRDLYMGDARSLPAHYWNSTTTLFEKRV
jgi:RimJ/RimL family protein N-acetyltransferase